MLIKTISLWEPWATAMALMLKTIETRHWDTSYRGPLAIHAAQRLMDAPEKLEPELVAEIRAHKLFEKCNYGKIVCIVDLFDIRRTDHIVKSLSRGGTFAHPEFIWGNYKPGRFGWMTRKCFPLAEPIAAKGKQGLWNWDTPKEFEPVINSIIQEAMIA